MNRKIPQYRVEKEARNLAIYKAHVQHGYLLKEIAQFLGTHYSTVSKAFLKSAPTQRLRARITNFKP
ncbi:MAG: hypothetical protein PHQ23_12605 [Candidatus Wallbacteria bacterium]|nr:hypothetical protein [Candidatus Wallbacteria bacterium]